MYTNLINRRPSQLLQCVTRIPDESKQSTVRRTRLSPLRYIPGVLFPSKEVKWHKSVSEIANDDFRIERAFADRRGLRGRPRRGQSIYQGGLDCVRNTVSAAKQHPAGATITGRIRQGRGGKERRGGLARSEETSDKEKGANMRPDDARPGVHSPTGRRGRARDGKGAP